METDARLATSDEDWGKITINFLDNQMFLQHSWCSRSHIASERSTHSLSLSRDERHIVRSPKGH